MKMLKLAAGFAAGYVLGSRAGREKYEQIAATARKVSANPTVIQAQEKAKSLLGVAPATTPATTPTPSLADTSPKPRAPKPPKTEPVSVHTPAAAGDPLI